MKLLFDQPDQNSVGAFPYEVDDALGYFLVVVRPLKEGHVSMTYTHGRDTDNGVTAESQAGLLKLYELLETMAKNASIEFDRLFVTPVIKNPDGPEIVGAAGKIES